MYNPGKKVTAASLKKLPCLAETVESLREFVSVEMVTDNVTLFGEFQSMDTNQIFKQICVSGVGQRPQKV